MKTIADFFPELKNGQLVRDFFGLWPSLHDSEIIEITLNRELCTDFSGPKMWLSLYTFNSIVAVDDPQRKPAKLILRFDNLELKYLEYFNHQNAMADFSMDKYFCDRLREERYKIEFGEFGACVEFTCKYIEVISIEPFQPIDYFENMK